MKIKKTVSDIILDVFCYFIAILISVSIIVPFWNLFVQSITPKSEISLAFSWFPKRVDWGAWELIFNSNYMWLCMKNTVIRTILGTAVGLIMLVTFAYPL